MIRSSDYRKKYARQVHQRRVFQASQDGDYRHHAARIDGKTDDGTAHLVPVDLAGTMEQLVEQEVELFMLGMSQLQGKQSPKRQLVQRAFPFVAPSGGIPRPHPPHPRRTGLPIG